MLGWEASSLSRCYRMDGLGVVEPSELVELMREFGMEIVAG